MNLKIIEKKALILHAIIVFIALFGLILFSTDFIHFSRKDPWIGEVLGCLLFARAIVELSYGYISNQNRLIRQGKKVNL